MPKRWGPLHTHYGICDASAAVFLKPGDTRFLVADDEDQQQTSLRLYDATGDGPPLREYCLSNKALAPDEEEPEIDLEGSAWLGNRVFWIGSHSRSKTGKARSSRHRLFATEVRPKKVEISGRPYCTLLNDISERLKLDLDKKLAPKNGGVSIEGLSATGKKGELIIAFRSPLIDGHALLVVFKNAEAVIDEGCAPIFGDPVFLDLGGLGVRSIEYWPQRQAYYLLAGPAGDNGSEFQLMRWPGPPSSRPELIDDVDFAAAGIGDDIAPEALLVEPESNTMYVLFDEGNRVVNGVKCKDSERKSFRSLSLSGGSLR
jgi:hypothetical protein